MHSILRSAALVAALLFPCIAAAAQGLPVSTKTLASTDRFWEIKVSYPQTGNAAADAVLAAYARKQVADFKKMKPDLKGGDRTYSLEVAFKVARNDGKMLGVVFSEYFDTGGAHPNSNTTTFDFLMPDGAQVFLPEIVDGPRGIAAVSRIATANLIRDIASGADPASDKDTITGGAGPLADNFKAFILYPTTLHIFFPPYQVASYAVGPQETDIPLAQLRDVMRSDWRAPSASFDCAKARSVNEKAICADPALARLDRQMAEAYQAGMHAAAYDPAAQKKLLDEQRAWLARTNAACAAQPLKSCLAKAVRARLDALTQPAP